MDRPWGNLGDAHQDVQLFPTRETNYQQNPDPNCRTSWLQRVGFCSTFNTQLFASTRWHRSSWSTWAVILGHPGLKEAATHCLTCLQRASRSFSTKKPKRLKSYLICKFLLKAKKQKLLLQKMLKGCFWQIFPLSEQWKGFPFSNICSIKLSSLATGCSLAAGKLKLL